VYTIIETPMYLKQASELITEAERETVASYLALNPTAGTVVPGSGGIRKLRWRSQRGGKRGGHRLIYLNKLHQGKIWLLMIYSKRQLKNISAHELAKVGKAIGDGN
jgi:hypothetical protein